MFFEIGRILQNPLLVIGIIFFIVVIVYVITEFLQMRYKTKEQKGFLMIGWGILLIVVAFVILFTTTISFLSDTMSEGKGETYTVNELKKLCSVEKLSETNYILYKDYKESCRVVDMVTFGSYILLALGPIFVIFGCILKVLYVKEGRKKGKTEPDDVDLEKLK